MFRSCARCSRAALSLLARPAAEPGGVPPKRWKLGFLRSKFVDALPSGVTASGEPAAASPPPATPTAVAAALATSEEPAAAGGDDAGGDVVSSLTGPFWGEIGFRCEPVRF